MNRRRFLSLLPALVAAPSVLSCRASRERLRIAAVGAGGKGATDIRCCSSEEIVAICDVDENMAVAARQAHPRAKFYFDWREMFDRESGNIDAVLVSTPDHLHAVIASHAIKLRKHVYCQKPLATTIEEAAYLEELAREYGVTTQMGNQGSAEDGLRRAVEVTQAGIIGHVTRIYVWSDRPIWPQGVKRPSQVDLVPAGLNWDNWIGPAPWRPFNRGAYHPFNWRGWYDFGTGALGDMGCHLLNLPFRAAQLGLPSSIEALSETNPNADTYPSSAAVRFCFAERAGLPKTELTWYDGNGGKGLPEALKPPAQLLALVIDLLDQVPASGCLMEGEQGVLFSPDDYGATFFLKLDGDKELRRGMSHPAVRGLPVSLPRIRRRGYADLKHHFEWIEACKGGRKPYSSFETAGALSQLILLGCLAERMNTKIEWDGRQSSVRSPRAAVQAMRREYRNGWHLA